MSASAVEQTDFQYYNNTGKAFHPIDSLYCAGAHLTTCLIATGDLQIGLNYYIVFQNPQNFALNVTYQYSLGEDCAHDRFLGWLDHSF